MEYLPFCKLWALAELADSVFLNVSAGFISVALEDERAWVLFTRSKQTSSFKAFTRGGFFFVNFFPPGSLGSSRNSHCDQLPGGRWSGRARGADFAGWSLGVREREILGRGHLGRGSGSIEICAHRYSFPRNLQAFGGKNWFQLFFFLFAPVACVEGVVVFVGRIQGRVWVRLGNNWVAVPWQVQKFWQMGSPVSKRLDWKTSTLKFLLKAHPRGTGRCAWADPCALCTGVTWSQQFSNPVKRVLVPISLWDTAKCLLELHWHQRNWLCLKSRL